MCRCLNQRRKEKAPLFHFNTIADLCLLLGEVCVFILFYFYIFIKTTDQYSLVGCHCLNYPIDPIGHHSADHTTHNLIGQQSAHNFTVTIQLTIGLDTIQHTV